MHLQWIRVGHFTTPEEEAQEKFVGGEYLAPDRSLGLRLVVPIARRAKAHFEVVDAGCVQSNWVRLVELAWVVLRVASTGHFSPYLPQRGL